MSAHFIKVLHDEATETHEFLFRTKDQMDARKQQGEAMNLIRD